MATVYVHKTRYSKHIFDQAEYYSIYFMDQEHKNQLGYFGCVSAVFLLEMKIKWKSVE